MENCVACRKAVEPTELIRCTPCQGAYHYKCLNMNITTYTNILKNYKSWDCPTCSNITSRKPRGDNSNTPVRKLNAMLNDTLLSCDGGARAGAGAGDSMHNTAAVADITNMDISNVCEASLLSQFGAMLDKKFDAFRNEFFSDIKVTIKHEINGAVSSLRNEFTSTTDFLVERQDSLELKISAMAKTVSGLTAERDMLQSDLRSLQKRLDTTEKISRSMNVEIQAVTERRNEDVLNIVRTLCEVTGCPISSTEILACRRVAKLNTSSDRPRNILVTLPSSRHRDNLISAVRRFNKAALAARAAPAPAGGGRAGAGELLHTGHLGVPGEKKLVYVTEHLSPECKELHAATRRAAKDKSYKFVWVKFGQVFVRKNEQSGAIIIKDKNCLNKLI